MTRGERWARFIVRHARAVVLGVAVLTLAMVVGMGRLRTHFDFEASLPAHHPFVQIDHQIREQFGGRKTLIVAVVPREGDVWRPEVLEVVSV